MVKIKLSRLVLPLARNVSVSFCCFACSGLIRFGVMGINALENGSVKHTAGVNNRLRLWFAGVCIVTPVLPRKFEGCNKPKKTCGVVCFFYPSSLNNGFNREI